MTDREKVIRDLRYLKSFGRVSDKPQITEIAEDAIAMIDTQYKLILEFQNLISIGTKMMNGDEAIKPKSKVRHGANAQIQHFCGNCNSMLHGKPKYCSECGKGVLW